MNRAGFVHQALCYSSDEEFLSGTAGFLRNGLDAGDAVLAVVREDNIALLGRALGSRSRHVEFADARDWYDLPSRTLGRYHAHCGRHGGDRRVRIVGEPVWTGRDAFETREWARYESLLNVAFAGTGHWILCPYDTRVLSGDLVRTALRTHPEVAVSGHVAVSSHAYADPADFCAERDGQRPPRLPAGPGDTRFDRGRSAAVRRALRAYAGELGLSEERTHDMVAAVHEVVVNSVRYGGGRGVVRLRRDDDYVVCEVSDDGASGTAPPEGFPGHLPPGPPVARGHGLWLARQLSDLLAEEFGPSGSVVQLYFRLPRPGLRRTGAASAAGPPPGRARRPRGR
ncbi:anti-sigma regulatory factor [Streptomyces fumigatiscleroticus]|nr:anti-sigma regulatory factor [Streptomyces fumigatiscleroticus]